MTDQTRTSIGPQRDQLTMLLTEWIPTKRWFAGKGRRLTTLRVLSAVDLPWTAAAVGSGPQPDGQPDDARTAPTVTHLVVGVELDDQHWQTYQVPIARYREPRPELEAIGRLGDGSWVYDAAGDPAAVGALLADVSPSPHVDPRATHDSPDDAPVVDPGPLFQPVTDPAGYRDLPARPLSVEQSNTSVAFGQVALVKLFRLLVPGINPDVEVHAALGTIECQSIGRCLGWTNGGWRDPARGHWVTGHFGMVQELLSPATDGWRLSLAMVAGQESFADHALVLGRATGAVHQDLRRVLPVHALDTAELTALVERLHSRLDHAAALVPQVAALAPGLHARIAEMGHSDRPVVVQRVHGDYHLGQVLLASDGWKLLDFEGEPGAAMSTRVLPDHPLRDVAGMLRSFAYAAAQGGADLPPEIVALWQAQCEEQFLAGYAQTGPVNPYSDSVILAAYLVDKAAYEARYESRNRPDWLPIPMAALEALAR